MQGRVKLPCMGYMQLLAPRCVVCQFVVIPAVTVSYCLFCGILGLCVNVSIPLRLFSLVSPSAWCLSIVTDGHTSSDRSPGPMLMCVCLGDICVVIGSSLMFLVFFVYVFDKEKLFISVLSQQGRTLTGLSISIDSSDRSDPAHPPLTISGRQNYKKMNICQTTCRRTFYPAQEPRSTWNNNIY